MFRSCGATRQNHNKRDGDDVRLIGCGPVTHHYVHARNCVDPVPEYTTRVWLRLVATNSHFLPVHNKVGNYAKGVSTQLLVNDVRGRGSIPSCSCVSVIITSQPSHQLTTKS